MSPPCPPALAPSTHIAYKNSYPGPFLGHPSTVRVRFRACRFNVTLSSECMRSLSRVVWSEGMYLGPHHFQVQSRYFEDSTKFAVSSLRFAPYGLAGCDLDADALQNGTLSLLHARGMFSD